MSAAARSSSYWAEAMASDGYLVECGRGVQGGLEHEWFVVISRKALLFPGLHKIPTDSWARKSSSPVGANEYWVSEPLSEADLRSRLMDGGLSTIDIDARLEWARQWATTITRQPGSEPVLWWPRLAD